MIVFNPGVQGGARLISYNCFYADICMFVYVSTPLRLLITSGAMWRDMDPIRLVKLVLQLLLINHCFYC